MNEPAGNFTPSAVNAASAIFIGDVLQRVAERDHVVRAVVRDGEPGGAAARRSLPFTSAVLTSVVGAARIDLSLISFTSTLNA